MITRAATADYTRKKQTGGAGQFARIKIVAEPLPSGGGFVFENKVVGGAVPKVFVPAVEKGLESVLGSGVLGGFPVVDLKISLVDVASHEVDSSVLAFCKEKASGKTHAGRDELAAILEFIRPGDELVMVKLDRLGRSTRDVLNLLRELEQKGAGSGVLELEFCTSTDTGRFLVTVLGTVAEMDSRFILECQRAGIEAAKRKGV
jgi:Elongation factor G, domain IV/Resolvase, N terminal domain